MGRSSGRSSGTLFRYAPSVFFAETPDFLGKTPKIGVFPIFSRKKSGLWGFHGKSHFFLQKNDFFLGKKIIDFSKNVPKSSWDALCVGRSSRRSFQKLRYMEGTFDVWLSEILNCNVFRYKLWLSQIQVELKFITKNITNFKILPVGINQLHLKFKKSDNHHVHFAFILFALNCLGLS